MRGRAVSAPMERLQLLYCRARKRMSYGGRVDPEIEPGNPVRLFLRARERPDDVQKLFFGHTHQRATQQRAERQRVTPVGEDAGQCDQILDFLSAEEALASLGRQGDTAPLQRFLVAPQFSASRRQQGNVAGLAETFRAGAPVDDGPAADQPRA